MPRIQPRAERQPLKGTWQVARVRLRTWITERGREPRRPYLTIAVSLPGQTVVGSEIVEAEPSPERVLAMLEQAMAQPHAGAPRRPGRVVAAEAELASALAPRLQALGIRCEQGETPELLEAVAGLEVYLRGKPMVPGLLETPGVSPEQVARVFAAAAYFYREAPWRLISDTHPIAMRFPLEGGEVRYAVVMGAAKMSYGLAVYRSLADVAATYSGVPPKALTTLFDHEAMNYGDVTEMPFSDLEALERYGWELAGNNAYPMPFAVTRSGQIRRPGPEDLTWYEVALRAVPPFVKEHLKPTRDRPQPAEVTMTVPVAGGEAAVDLRYPAVELTRRRFRRRDRA